MSRFPPSSFKHCGFFASHHRISLALIGCVRCTAPQETRVHSPLQEWALSNSAFSIRRIRSLALYGRHPPPSAWSKEEAVHARHLLLSSSSSAFLPSPAKRPAYEGRLHFLFLLPFSIPRPVSLLVFRILSCLLVYCAAVAYMPTSPAAFSACQAHPVVAIRRGRCTQPGVIPETDVRPGKR